MRMELPHIPVHVAQQVSDHQHGRGVYNTRQLHGFRITEGEQNEGEVDGIKQYLCTVYLA